MSVELFKKRNDGLGNLCVSPRSKGRNGGRVILEHRRGYHKNRPYSSSIAPTNPQLKIVLIVEDYGLKGIIRKNKGRAEMTLPLKIIW